MTITALAQTSGMERPNLSRLEHGKHVPSLDTLERIAKALRVSVVELIAAG
jgi:transcriptional regulator with XRE-family HTH domain